MTDLYEKNVMVAEFYRRMSDPRVFRVIVGMLPDGDYPLWLYDISEFDKSVLPFAPNGDLPEGDARVSGTHTGGVGA